MTKNSDFKKLVRERMKKTGESYTAARRHLEDHPPEDSPKKASLEGWYVTGPLGLEEMDYDGELDDDVTHQGKPCAVLYSTAEEPASHGVIMQSIDSGAFLGDRIRFSAWVRCEEGTANARLWVRVVAVDRVQTFARGVFNATPTWQYGQVVVDIDPSSESIMFGLSLHGAGRVWMSGASFERVPSSVPLTQEGAVQPEPAAPINLGFQG